MREAAIADASDGISWNCPQCKSRKSIRDGSFFSKSHLTLQQWLMLIFFWLDEEPISKACEHCETSLATGMNVYQWLRKVCSTRLIQDGNPQLGGPGFVVENDESCFCHKPKVIVILAKNSLIMIYFYCLKHHRGRPPVQNIGMV